MKKKSLKIGALILAALMIANLLSLSCFAVDAANYSKPTITLGSVADDEGTPEYFAQFDNELAPNSRSLLFTLTATGVKDLLTTKAAGKEITKDSLTKAYVRVSGTLSHERDGSSPRGGLCFENFGTGQFDSYPGLYKDFTSGISGTLDISKRDLSNTTTYYGFVKNNYYADSGTISGKLNYYEYD